MGAGLSVGSKLIPFVSNALPIIDQLGGGGQASFLANAPDTSRDAERGGRDINALSSHFVQDIEAMDQASQQGTVSPGEWQCFYIP